MCDVYYVERHSLATMIQSCGGGPNHFTSVSKYGSGFRRDVNFVVFNILKIMNNIKKYVK